MSVPAKIVIADSQPLYREGIKAMLHQEEDLEVVAEAKDTDELIPKLQSFEPDVLILDYNPKYFNSDGLLSWLKVHLDCKVVILSSQDKKWEILRSLKLNVFAYLTKESSREEIVRAIRLSVKGEKFFCSYVLNILTDQSTMEVSKDSLDRVNQLTTRELEIAKLVSAGNKNKEIADRLNVSPHTIHTHRKNILKKLKVSSALELSNLIKGI